MDNLTNINAQSANYSSQETYIKKGNKEILHKEESLSYTSVEAAVYEQGDKEPTKKVTYKADMEKVKAMKEETDRRLMELLKDTVKSGTIKQLGGLRGILGKLRSNEVRNSENKHEINLEEIELDITEEDIVKAQEETSEDGYWGVEQTSNRFLEFAQALSGGDPSKADALLEAVKEGYKLAEEIWGGELPELSQKTLEVTIKKFEAWRDGEEYVPEEESHTTDMMDQVLDATTVQATSEYVDGDDE